MNASICSAIKNRQLVEFIYDGRPRVVEPHCYGLLSSGHEALRAYQVDGFSSSGKYGMKLFDLTKASNIRTLEKTFADARPEYSKGDRQMKSIYCEI